MSENFVKVAESKEIGPSSMKAVEVDGEKVCIIPENEFLREIPQGYDVPFKGMLILTQKQDDLFAIIFLNPKEKFDSMLKEIQPTLDSIELTSYTVMEN